MFLSLILPPSLPPSLPLPLPLPLPLSLPCTTDPAQSKRIGARPAARQDVRTRALSSTDGQQARRRLRESAPGLLRESAPSLLPVRTYGREKGVVVGFGARPAARQCSTRRSSRADRAASQARAPSFDLACPAGLPGASVPLGKRSSLQQRPPLLVLARVHRRAHSHSHSLTHRHRHRHRH